MCAQPWRSVLAMGLVTSLIGFTMLAGSACGGGHEASPGSVALAYLEAVYGDNVKVAIKYVAPQSAYIPELVDTLIGPQSVKVLALAVKSEIVDGDKATVQLVGKICSSGNRRPLEAIPVVDRHCVSSDGTGANRGTFVVQLGKVSSRWLVEFPDAHLPGG